MARINRFNFSKVVYKFGMYYIAYDGEYTFIKVSILGTLISTLNTIKTFIFKYLVKY